MAAQAELIGADRARRTMRAAAAELADLQAAAEATGQLVASRATSRAPRRSGRLAASIGYEARGDQVSVGSGLVYAPVQEYGSPRKHIPAQPYLRPALNESTDRIVTTYELAVGATVAKIKGA